jgi:hypothetical protein
LKIKNDSSVEEELKSYISNTMDDDLKVLNVLPYLNGFTLFNKSSLDYYYSKIIKVVIAFNYNFLVRDNSNHLYPSNGIVDIKERLERLSVYEIDNNRLFCDNILTNLRNAIPGDNKVDDYLSNNICLKNNSTTSPSSSNNNEDLIAENIMEEDNTSPQTTIGGNSYQYTTTSTLLQANKIEKKKKFQNNKEISRNFLQFVNCMFIMASYSSRYSIICFIKTYNERIDSLYKFLLEDEYLKDLFVLTITKDFNGSGRSFMNEDSQDKVYIELISYFVKIFINQLTKVTVKYDHANF